MELIVLWSDNSNVKDKITAKNMIISLMITNISICSFPNPISANTEFGINRCLVIGHPKSLYLTWTKGWSNFLPRCAIRIPSLMLPLTLRWLGSARMGCNWQSLSHTRIPFYCFYRFSAKNVQPFWKPQEKIIIPTFSKLLRAVIILKCVSASKHLASRIN